MEDLQFGSRCARQLDASARQQMQTWEQQGLKSIAEVDSFLARLPTLTILVEDDTHARALTDILQLSRRIKVSANDAAYLELAIRLCLPLATIDVSLTRAAYAAGVSLYVP